MQSVGQSTSLFRPVPPSSLQSNLAQHYQRTSEFVSDKFNDMRSGEGTRASEARASTTSENESGSSRTDDSERIRPYGMGTVVDLYA